MIVPVRLAPFRLPPKLKVNPFARRRDLELEVMLRLADIGCDEDFAHVALPEGYGLLCGLRRVAYHKRLVLPADEAHAERLLRPDDASFCVALRPCFCA